MQMTREGGNEMPTEKPRIIFVISKAMEKKIQDIRFNGRFNTQAEVVRYLIEVGLNQVMDEISTPDGLEQLRKKLENARCNNLDESDYN
jgi:Arc/MetJ-type ribon-helix-helix transcriptional regulator